MNVQAYSVLMSVYYKESASYLQESMESILCQTVPTDDFVLICDGQLTDELNAVIRDMEGRFGSVLHVIRLQENQGLGNALRIGMQECRHSLIARMDSDDIAMPARCEKQLEAFRAHPDVSIVSGTVLEFHTSPKRTTGVRVVPELDADIRAFSRKRNPFNHPVVMFKREDVIAVGDYQETYHLFEDYYLWVRMLQAGFHGYNIQEPILYMRTPKDIYRRRGGVQYAKDMLRFHKWVKRSGWSRPGDYLFGAIPHAAVCVLPNGMRKQIYKVLHKAPLKSTGRKQ